MSFKEIKQNPRSNIEEPIFLHLIWTSTILFEETILDQIMSRWLSYKPILEGTLAENIEALLLPLASADVRLEMHPTHIQIFDTSNLNISAQMFRQHGTFAYIFQPLFPFFRTTKINRGQTDISLTGFAYNQKMDDIIDRQSLLQAVVLRICEDASMTNEAVYARALTMAVLRKIYHNVKDTRKSAIAKALEAIRPKYQNLRKEKGVFSKYKFVETICATRFPDYCPQHTKNLNTLKKAFRIHCATKELYPA